MTYRKKIIIVSMVTVSILVGVFGYFRLSETQAQGTAVHPRLLFMAAEVPTLQQKVTDGIGVDDAAFDTLIDYAELRIPYSGSSLLNGDGFNSLPALAVAYHLSADTNPNKFVYRDKCKEAALYQTSIYDSSGGPYPAAQRLFALVQAFDMCFEAATSQERQIVITEMEEYIATSLNPTLYYANYYYRPYINNVAMMVVSALGMSAIALEGETANTQLLNDAWTYVEAVLDNGLASNFEVDGAYNEGVLYAGWSMRFLIPYFEARLRYDGVDYSQRPEIKNLVNWLAYGVRPNQYNTINNLNDTLQWTFPLSLHNTVLDWASTKYDSDLAKWLRAKLVFSWNYRYNRDLLAAALWGPDTPEVDPDDLLPDSQVFDQRGLYYYRTGWPSTSEGETMDSVFSLYSGKYLGGHDQEDQGQYTLFSKGEDFIRDTGYANAARQTRGHNLILIDGNGQHNAGNHIGTDGSIESYVINPFADYLHTDNKSAYDTFSEYNEDDWPLPGYWDWSYGRRDANPVIKAKRLVLAVKKSTVGEYFIIYDNIEKDGDVHTYDWLLHTNNANTFDTTSNPVNITGGTLGNKLDIHFINPQYANLNFTEELFALDYPDGNTNRLSVSTDAVNPEFFAILHPKDVSGNEPTFTTTNLNVVDGHGARLDWDNSTKDIILYNKFSEARSIVTGDNVASDGRFALTRRTGNSLANYMLADGTSLMVNDTQLVTVSGGSASVANDGNILTINDASLGYVAYGPEVTSVINNEGAAVDYVKYDGYVYINVTPPPDTIPPETIDDLRTI